MRPKKLVIVEARAIPLALLRSSSWNVNRVHRRMRRKINRSLQEFGVVENLVARPHPSEAGAYELLSGSHRVPMLKRAGVTEAQVVVVDVSDAQARLLAQALNRTRGRDDPAAHRALMAELRELLSDEEIGRFLPHAGERVAGRTEEQQGDGDEDEGPERAAPIVYGVIADCTDAADQTLLMELLAIEGRSCRPLLGERSPTGESRTGSAKQVKAARERADYRSSTAKTALGRAKAKAHKAARRRLRILDPAKTCVAIAELRGHVCSGPIECHHRDGNWRNGADENLCWVCRTAHEELDAILGI